MTGRITPRPHVQLTEAARTAHAILNHTGEPMPTTRRPWQVIRRYHTGGGNIIRTHRHRITADLHAGLLDFWAVVRCGGATPDRHYDVRPAIDPTPR